MKEYILAIVAASILCGVVIRLLKDKSVGSAIVKMLCGIILAIIVIQPALKLEVVDTLPSLEGVLSEAQTLTTDGSYASNREIRSIICKQVEAYILDKASAYDCNLEVTVSLSDGSPPVPKEVELHGNISPFAKQNLQLMIESDIGIPKERQIWR